MEQRAIVKQSFLVVVLVAYASFLSPFIAEARQSKPHHLKNHGQKHAQHHKNDGHRHVKPCPLPSPPLTPTTTPAPAPAPDVGIPPSPSSPPPPLEPSPTPPPPTDDIITPPPFEDQTPPADGAIYTTPPPNPPTNENINTPPPPFEDQTPPTEDGISTPPPPFEDQTPPKEDGISTPPPFDPYPTVWPPITGDDSPPTYDYTPPSSYPPYEPHQCHYRCTDSNDCDGPCTICCNNGTCCFDTGILDFNPPPAGAPIVPPPPLVPYVYKPPQNIKPGTCGAYCSDSRSCNEPCSKCSWMYECVRPDA